MYLEQIKQVLLIGCVIFFITTLLAVITVFWLKKKQKHHVENISMKKVIFVISLITYTILLLYTVFWRRIELNNYSCNFRLFDSFKYAWYSNNLIEWRNIVLNIIMFIPLGFFLPIIFNKHKKIYIIIPFVIGVTVGIEFIQFAIKIGIFQLDDIINNTLGGIIGYGFYIFATNIRNPRKRKFILSISITPFILTILFFVVVWQHYEQMPYGNLVYSYSSNVEVQELILDKNINLIDGNDTSYILTTDKMTMLTDVERIAEQFGVPIEGMTIKDEENLKVYKIDDERSINYDKLSGFFTYVDYKDVNSDGKDEFSIEDEAQVRDILKSYSIDIPEYLEYATYGERTCAFTVNDSDCFEKLIAGDVTCDFNPDGTLSTLSYSLYKFDKITEVKIIDSDELIDRIRQGKFYAGNEAVINQLIINDILLTYDIDSKEFYQPVYFISAVIDNNSCTLTIPAIKE